MVGTLSTAAEESKGYEVNYFDLPGLSYSTMKDLAVSPTRYWYLHINPNRPLIEPTREMQIGQALHCAVLEPAKFDQRYACELIPPDDCLDTMEDLRSFLRERGVTPKGTRKAEVIAQVQAVRPSAPILDTLKAQHAAQNEGRMIFCVDDWARIQGCAKALVQEPRIIEVLEQGESEKAFFATDPETGVHLKAKMDWVTPKLTLDLKTFQQKRSKSLDQSVADAIWFEGYYVQAYFYTMLRQLQPGANRKDPPDFLIAFVESEEPHEVRLKVLRPTTAGEPSLYWMQARTHVQRMIRLYAACIERYGNKPWRSEQKVDPLMDEDLKQLAWAS